MMDPANPLAWLCAAPARVAALIVGWIGAVTLCAAATGGEPVGWRMNGTGRFPDATPATDWSPTSNVVWSTAMPSWSNASPILVGERLLVSSEPSTLVALDVGDGHILWQHDDPVEAVANRGSKELSFLYVSARQVEVQHALAQTEYEVSASRRKLTAAPDDAALTASVRDAVARARVQREELAGLALAMPPQHNPETGLSAPTPASDGESVFVLYGTGVAASYSLDGRRRWVRFLDQPPGTDGVSASPVLVGDKVLFVVSDLIAVDKATGEVAWRAEVPPSFGTPAPFRVEDQDFVALPSGHVVRVTDGAVVGTNLGALEIASPLIQDRVLYFVDLRAKAYRLPETLSEPLGFKLLWSAQVKGSRYFASPVWAEGLLYTITRNQFLNAVDAATGTTIFTERLSLGSEGGSNSVYSSPTFAGGYLFVSGFGGTTVVARPGRTFERVAVNQLEKFRSSPIFQGDRMYVRGYAHTFCIAAPRKP